MESESHSFPFGNRALELGIIILSDDSKMGGSFGESLSDEALSMNTLASMFHEKLDGGENLANSLMPPHVLTEAKIEVTHQRRECTGLFVKTYQESTGHEPSDAEIARNMECQWRHEAKSWVNPSDHHKIDILARRCL